MSGQHEHSDANVRSLVVAAAGLFGLILIALVAMWAMFAYLAHRGRVEQGPPPAMAQTQEIPPAPRLQISPTSDLERLRAAEDAVLNSYGWVDRKAGTVRIPISRAMDLVAQRSLAATPSTKK
jgi:hypothetical protein